MRHRFHARPTPHETVPNGPWARGLFSICPGKARIEGQRSRPWGPISPGFQAVQPIEGKKLVFSHAAPGQYDQKCRERQGSVLPQADQQRLRTMAVPLISPWRKMS